MKYINLGKGRNAPAGLGQQYSLDDMKYDSFVQNNRYAVGKT